MSTEANTTLDVACLTVDGSNRHCWAAAYVDGRSARVPLPDVPNQRSARPMNAYLRMRFSFSSRSCCTETWGEPPLFLDMCPGSLRWAFEVHTCASCM